MTEAHQQDKRKRLPVWWCG